jgi:hypothetical protein
MAYISYNLFGTFGLVLKQSHIFSNSLYGRNEDKEPDTQQKEEIKFQNERKAAIRFEYLIF